MKFWDMLSQHAVVIKYVNITRTFVIEIIQNIM